LGTLDNTCNLTELRCKIAELPMYPPLSKMLIESADFGFSQEVLIIVSVLSVPSIFFRPTGCEQESDLVWEKFFVPKSDHSRCCTSTTSERSQLQPRVGAGHFVYGKAFKKVREMRVSSWIL